MTNDAIDPTDSTFEDHWDKLEIKLNEWASLQELCNLMSLKSSTTISHRLSFKDLWLIVSTSMPLVWKLNLAHRKKR